MSDSEDELWLEIAKSAEIMGGTSTSANDTVAGYMLRTARALSTAGVAPVNTPISVATRPLLAALDTSLGLPAILTEAGREGVFVWTTGDLSAKVASDIAQGMYVPPAAPADITGGAGAWVRVHNGILRPEWFDGSIAATAAYANVNGGGIIHARGVYTIGSVVALTAGTILDNTGTITASAAMTNMFTVTGNGAGITGDGTFNAAGLVTGYAISATDGDALVFEDFEVINWKYALEVEASTRDIERPRVRRLRVHTPIAANPVYPIRLGGGPNYYTVYDAEVEWNEVDGVDGNYQLGTGTADQITLQNCVGGEVAFNRSGRGGENGIAVSRLSRRVNIHDNYCWGSDGYGVQLGSSHVELTLNTIAGLAVDQVLTGSISLATGTIKAIRGLKVFCNPTTGEFTTSDTVNAGANAVTAVQYGDGSRLVDNTAIDNNSNAGAAGAFLVTWQKGHATLIDGNRSSNLTGNGLVVSSSDNIDYGVNDFSAPGGLAESWSASSDYRIASEFEYQVTGVAIPALQPGEGAVVTFTISGIVTGQWITVAATATTGLSLIPKARTTDTVDVQVVNLSGAAVAATTSVFRFRGRQRGVGLSTTAGASASVGAVQSITTPSARRATDLTVNNSTALVDGLTVAVSANRSYAFRALLHVNSGVTPGYKIGFTVPASATGGYVTADAAAGVSTTDIAATTTGTGSVTSRIMDVRGFVTVGATAGNLVLRFAQNTADPTDSKLLAGSYLQLVS